MRKNQKLLFADLTPLTQSRCIGTSPLTNRSNSSASACGAATKTSALNRAVPRFTSSYVVAAILFALRFAILNQPWANFS
jgi:hypothetical protein